ncbi:MAG: HEAT repeat domain-containing protein, partial [Bacteroidota bacterium]
ELAKADPSLAPQALEALLKAAGDPNDNVRSAAASALGELAKADPILAPKTLEALLKAVGDHYAIVRSAAAWALKEVKRIMNRSVAPEEKKQE